MAARHVSIFADAADNELARVHGLDVGDSEPDPIGPITCPRCDRDIRRESCVWCGQATDPSAAEAIREREDRLRTAVMRSLREDPLLIEDVQRAQDLLAVLEGRPDLVRPFTLSSPSLD